jgi:hypothetical protein
VILGFAAAATALEHRTIGSSANAAAAAFVSIISTLQSSKFVAFRAAQVVSPHFMRSLIEKKSVI